ncbi:poly(3-hydroxybutyrate) depolymerase [Parabacteroides sp. PFB2-12]|nr:PHB depolymerase family esterase [Parabacteroides sp. PFB2-12]MDH6390885.1 poly(3-hydroxybutyrate) depolymerase [Parabacteroides sp. PFB2-12]
MMIMALQAIGQVTIQVAKVDKLDHTVYLYRDTTRSIDGYAGMTAPMFMIYPDTPLSETEANALINELEIGELVVKYAGSVGVINPVGKTYDNKADLEAYKAFINRMRNISNLKIIGIGRGATFVNNVISRNAAEVAGIFTYGGTMKGKTASHIPVPAYISQGNRSLASYYAKANDAVEVKRDEAHIYYINDREPLQQVVLSLNKKASLKEAFADAWKTLLSKNYRFSNYKHTSYMGAQFGQYGNYELEPYLILDELGVSRKTVKKSPSGGQNLPGSGLFFWYEYLPEKAANAPKGSVPLVVLLHGNANDNRTQSETGGFIEIAAEEGFIVAEIEWQGAGPNRSELFLGLDGIEYVVYDVMQTYPQIDPSRIYVQGLSAGGMASAALGIKKSHLFAAVGGHSGAIFDRWTFGSSYQSLRDEATQKAGYVQMPYFLISGTADDVVRFPTVENHQNNPYHNAIRVYQHLNQIPETAIDFAAEPVLGMKMHKRETILTNKHLTLEIGKLYKGDMPLIQFTAIIDYGHWNYRPAAQMMWDFFKQYSRDPETKKLIYHPQ